MTAATTTSATADAVFAATPSPQPNMSAAADLGSGVNLLPAAAEPSNEVQKELLTSVAELLRNEKYHDVLFVCRDGSATCNRSFLSARCPYFDVLLFGGMREASSRTVHVESSKAALQSILDYLYTGTMPAASSTNDWLVLAETASLAQQYMIPRVVSTIAEQLVAVLNADILGPALSYAISADLQPVVDKIWKALPRLLTTPVSARAEGLSPAALTFCLEHVYPVMGPAGSTCTLAATTTAAEAEAMRQLLQYACSMRAACPDCQRSASSTGRACLTPPPAAEGAGAGTGSGVDAGASGTAAAAGSSSGSKQAAGGGTSSCSVSPFAINSGGGSTGSGQEGEGDPTSQQQAGASSSSRSSATGGQGNPTSSGSHGCGAPASSSGPYGPCCRKHQAALGQLLMQINWHLVPASLLEELDSLQLLSDSTLLSVYRAHRLSPYSPVMGCLDNRPGDGLHCFIQEGHQTVVCQALAHNTVTGNFPLTSGRYSWQVLVHTSCDLAWVGVSDGSVPRTSWGGRERGGWYYGSNDALCHAATTDHRAYMHYCGHGKWGDGAVVTVYLDMDAREVWFAVNGAEPRPGFTGLPGCVYPSVSLRAPGRLSFRFRPHMWANAGSDMAAGGGRGDSVSPCGRTSSCSMGGSSRAASSLAGASPVPGGLCGRATSV